MLSLSLVRLPDLLRHLRQEAPAQSLQGNAERLEAVAALSSAPRDGKED
jgi:hypothetical protein